MLNYYILYIIVYFLISRIFALFLIKIFTNNKALEDVIGDGFVLLPGFGEIVLFVFTIVGAMLIICGLFVLLINYISDLMVVLWKKIFERFK